MIFSNKNTNTVKLNIDNINIRKVKEVNFLGVIIDKKPSWKPQINNVKSKIAKAIAVLHKVKWFSDSSS